MRVEFTVNGKEVVLETPGARRLLDVLRQDLRLIGTKEGCGEGECGACSVLVGERVVNACLIPVGQMQGERVLTIEGLEAAGGRAFQEAFLQLGAAQCGICTPGMLMAAYAFYLRRGADSSPPTDQEIRVALAGNLCRCTGYQRIVDAVAEGFARSPEFCASRAGGLG